MIQELLTTDDIARLLRKSVHSVRHDIKRNPKALPLPLDLPRTRRKLWCQSEVDKWLASHVVVPTDAPPDENKNVQKAAPARNGSSTKAERVRARAAGLSVRQLRAREEAQKS